MKCGKIKMTILAFKSLEQPTWCSPSCDSMKTLWMNQGPHAKPGLCEIEIKCLPKKKSLKLSVTTRLVTIWYCSSKQL